MGVEWLTILLFCFIILLSNIIQGITGFAGTLIAMPFLIMLVDLETAKQVLNVLGILGSLWIITKDYQYIDWQQLKKILTTMLIGLVVGITSYTILPKNILLLLFPLFVLFVGVKGLLSSLRASQGSQPKSQSPWLNTLLLLSAGIIHGLFVSGGPLLVAYATKNIAGKYEFRATLSAVWIVLNTIILSQSIVVGAIDSTTVAYMGLAVIPLFMGIVIGGKLLKRMSLATFMLLSYGLLIVSGISLLL